MNWPTKYIEFQSTAYAIYLLFGCGLIIFFVIFFSYACKYSFDKIDVSKQT